MSQSNFKPHLSWLGAAAVIAGCLTVSVFERPAFAQLTHVQTTVCRGAASGQVTASARGRPQEWASAALNTLCANTEISAGPGECFAHVMTSNSVNYGGGTTWDPNNALRLCAGAADASRRIQCFERKIGEGVAWSQAIDQCVAEDRPTLQARGPSLSAPAVTAPMTRPATEAEINATRQNASSTNGNMVCEGPLVVSADSLLTSDVRAGLVIRATFTPATSAASVQPGQCWREGGWGGGALMRTTTGTLEFVSRQGPCAAIPQLRFRNGAVTDLAAIDTPATDLLNLGRAGLGEVTLVTRYAGVDTSGADTPSLFMVQQYGPPRPAQCR